MILLFLVDTGVKEDEEDEEDEGGEGRWRSSMDVVEGGWVRKIWILFFRFSVNRVSGLTLFLVSGLVCKPEYICKPFLIINKNYFILNYKTILI